MNKKNISDLLLDSKHSILQQSNMSKPSRFERGRHYQTNNQQQLSSTSSVDAKNSQTLKNQLSSKVLELQKMNSVLHDYKDRETQWRKHQKLMKQQICHLRNSNLRLHEQIQFIKHNHENEISFYMKKQKETLTTISTFLQANQVQRMEIFIQNQLSHFQFQGKTSQKLKNSKLQNTQKTIIPSQFLFLDEFVTNTHKIIEETSINVQDFKKLPQMLKLKKQKDVPEKKLNWYLQQLPFEELNKSRRQKVCKYILKNSSSTMKKKGEDILNFIMKVLLREVQDLKSVQVEEKKYMKSEMSELIQLNTKSRFRVDEEEEHRAKID